MSSPESTGKRRCRLAVVIPSLAIGGAERIAITLLRHLDPGTFEVHLITFHRADDFSRDLPSHVIRHPLHAEKLRAGVLRYISTLRSLRPEVIFSLMAHTNVLTLSLRPFLSGHPRIVCFESSAMSSNTPMERHPALMRRLCHWLYPKAHRIICQTQANLDDARQFLGVAGDNFSFIYNPVDSRRVLKLASRDGSPFTSQGPNVVCVGRFDRVKGHDRAIESFCRWKADEPGLQLHILGAGKRGHDLQDLARRSGHAAAIHFPDDGGNPFRWIAHADLFLLPSRYEGCPMALLETLALHGRVLVFRHPGGTAEVMGQLGLEARLVDQDVAWNPLWLENVKGCCEKLRERFDAAIIVRQYTRMFLDQDPEP